MASACQRRDSARTEPRQYFAHSENDAGRRDPAPTHLLEVARLAAQGASAFGAADEAKIAALLHDLGKYGELFQDRLRGAARGVHGSHLT